MENVTLSPAEMEFLNYVKYELGFNELALNLEHILDIACFESIGDTDKETKAHMFIVNELIKQLRLLPT